MKKYNNCAWDIKHVNTNKWFIFLDSYIRMHVDYSIETNKDSIIQNQFNISYFIQSHLILSRFKAIAIHN